MPDNDGLHKHAFWLYGVIVGLAIREALTKNVPHIISPPEGPWWATAQDGVRLLLFLILIVRFYLGSAYYFEEAHVAPGATAFSKKNYFVDFLFGLAHFIIFFGWGLSIDFHSGHNYYFLLGLLGILLYDVVWFWLCRKYETRHLIKLWVALNVFTVIISLLFFLIMKLVTDNHALMEVVALIPVFVFSIIDIVELTSGRRFFAGWLTSLVQRPHEQRPGAS
jgi:hypothetical protein